MLLWMFLSCILLNGGIGALLGVSVYTGCQQQFGVLTTPSVLKVKPREPFLKKYCNPKKIQGLELHQIRTFGRQILEVW